MKNPFEIIDNRLSNIECLLLDLKHAKIVAASPTETERLLTVKEAAKFLCLSVATVYSLTSKGELPSMKRSKRCYYSSVDLMNYLKAGKRKSNKEISDAADKYLKGKAVGNE